MTVCSGQSGWRSANNLENSARTSAGEWLSIKGFVSLVAGNPSSARSRNQGSANKNRLALCAHQYTGPQNAGPNQRNLRVSLGATGSTGKSWVEKKNIGM